MAELGKYNTLVINRFVDFGAFLDDGEEGEILIPSKYLSGDEKEGDTIDVFYYLDSEERPVATTETPAAEADEIGVMTVGHVNDFGAFMEWGITKNLFVPFQEQQTKLIPGEKHLVYVYVDPLTYRLVGSTRLKNHIDTESDAYEVGQEVRLLVYRSTPIGIEAVINEKSLGMLYKNEVFTDLSVGDSIIGYIKNIREDGKIDLSLQTQGYEHVEDFSDILLRYIKDQGGKINIHDKSDPELIHNTFGVSKKVFKKAVGKLYKEKKITLLDNGLQSVI